ncbi:DMT family transporter [Amycolatopsis nigrescens]|uniref:DMT family transporter n=1 Tax=Amycolatopsis nigrescens TaxID=381445 RepID=UPI00146AFE7D|nr:DMT family transporter [Amycolatopsis nigrescens]
MPPGTATLRGATFAVLACLLWGLDVFVPLLLPGFGAMTIAASRFLAYGLVSLLILAARGRLSLVAGYGPRVLGQCLLLGAVGEFAYYVFVVLGVKFVGGPVVAVIIGILPVTVTVCGGSEELPVRRLAVPITLILSGVLLVNLTEIDWREVGSHGPAGQLLGVGCAIAALAMWTWFAVANARFLNRNPQVSAADWSAMLGVATLVPAAVTAPFVLDLSAPGGQLAGLAAGALVLGLAVSWLGTVFWNRASRGLSVSLLGQLMVFETIASLTYIFLHAGTAPPPVEVAGIALAVIGLSLGIGIHQSTHKKKEVG